MYKVRAKRREDGSYDLSYGKGRNKVQALTKKDPSNNKWFVDVVGHYKKLGELKTAWGKWAEARYHGSSGVSKAKGETAPDTPTPLPPVGLPEEPPPVSNRRRKTAKPARPLARYGLAMFQRVPNDPLFRYSLGYPDPAKRGKATPLGMLLSIQQWCELYKERIADVNHGLAMRKIPGYNPFSFLKLMVEECVDREVPEDRKTHDDNVFNQPLDADTVDESDNLTDEGADDNE